MKKAILALVWLGALFISAIFVDSLRFKFTGHSTPEHIFTTLRAWSGIGLFYPAGPWIIGLGELLSSLLLVAAPLVLALTGRGALAGKSQAAGALIALGIMSGAIFFHLFTPLGIETPVEWSGSTPTAYSPALFYSACASWAFAAVILAVRGPTAIGR
jgi:hypothetical protein